MRHLQAILDTLKDLPDEAQRPFRDATMICSENEWHDMVHTNVEEIVDMNTTDYTWYREDDLEGAGYVHESDIIEMAVNDIEGLVRQLGREKEPQTIISIETLHKLYKSYKPTAKTIRISKVDEDLVTAILSENGYE